MNDLVKVLEDNGYTCKDLSRGKPEGEHIWTCKIGGSIKGLPPGADLPMRQAIEEAFYKLTGTWPEFNFSGWGGELDRLERDVLND